MVTQASYQARLESLGILIKAKNFLVFQVNVYTCKYEKIYCSMYVSPNLILNMLVSCKNTGWDCIEDEHE